MITPDGTALSAPAIADNGTATVITVRRRGNTLQFYWHARGVAQWYKSATTEQRPAI